jgi:hypothetical protein
MKLRTFLFVGAITAASCQPSYDRSRLDPAFARLQTPYQSVQGANYSDGGSVSVKIVDHRGQSQFFFVSAEIQDPKPYSRVYVGGIPGQGTGVREARDPEAAKRVLAELLKSQGPSSRDNDISIAALTGSTFYSARSVLRGLLGESP